MAGDLDAVKEFVLKGANVNAMNNNGNTPLHLAALWDHLEVVQYLIEDCKASVHAKNVNGHTPLHIAAFEGHIEMVQYLVEDGKASVDAVNNDGETPLHLVAWWGRLVIAQYLVEIGNANIFMRDTAGDFPSEMGSRLVVTKYLKERVREQTLAAARNALNKIPDDVFMYLTTFISV